MRIGEMRQSSMLQHLEEDSATPTPATNNEAIGHRAADPEGRGHESHAVGPLQQKD